jgi:hypothetical protein
MYKFYGIILFIFLLILIYLLNMNNNQNQHNQYTQEGFDNLDDYINIPGVAFNSDSNNLINLDTPLSLENVLKQCNTDACKGITIISSNNPDSITSFYKIKDLNSSISRLQGSGSQRINAKKATSYIKRSVQNIDKLYLSEDTMRNQTFNICHGDMYLCVINNKLQFMNKYKIQAKKLINSTKFKISERPNNNIAIQDANTGKYIIHNFPSNDYLTLSEGSNVSNENSIFRITAFNQNGFVLKLVGFTDMYVSYSNHKDNKENNVIVTKIVAREDTKSAIFNFGLDIEDTEISLDNQPVEMYEVSNAPENVGLTQKDRLVIFKNKNSNIIDKQSAVLEDQNNKIKNLEMLHFSNIGDISREFAYQSAKLAFSKYMNETQQTVDNKK